MPQQTIIREEFAKAVELALGGLTPNQASYKTQVSDEWIRKMTKGRVPSESILERFAKGLDADLHALRIAAGYEKPDDALEAVTLALRDAKNMSESSKEEVLRMVQKYIEQDAAELERRKKESSK